MKKEECPRGTVATIGHPSNSILIVKGADGDWRYVDNGGTVDYDTIHKASWDVVTMPVDNTQHIA